MSSRFGASSYTTRIVLRFSGIGVRVFHICEWHTYVPIDSLRDIDTDEIKPLIPGEDKERYPSIVRLEDRLPHVHPAPQNGIDGGSPIRLP
jgi:hypothetical protein